MCEKSATLKKDLIPTQVACVSSPNGGCNDMGRGTNSSVAMSLFDQLKNSVSHNLSVTDRTTNHKNGHKVETLLSHHNDLQETQHSTKKQIYQARSLLKPLTNKQQQQEPEQQQLFNAHANDTNTTMIDDDDDGEDDDNNDDDDEEDEIKDEDNEEPSDLCNYVEQQQEQYKNNDHLINDAAECNDSSESSISATTAPLQIALDSSSSHSSNSNNSFLELTTTTTTSAAANINLMSDKSRKLSTNSDQMEKFEEQQLTSSTIACQTQPLSFLSNSSTKTTTTANISDDIKTTITSTTSNLTLGNFCITDVGKTVLDCGEYMKKTVGEQQKIKGTAGPTSSSTVSPLLGIVQGTKRATKTPTAIPTTPTPTPPAFQHKKQNTRSVVSTNSLAHSAISVSSLVCDATTTTSTTAIEVGTKTRKSNKNLSNDLSIYATQQTPIEQNNFLHQVSKTTPTHFQRNQHKTTGINLATNNTIGIKRVQKSVLDFGRLAQNELSINNRIDNKRKRCNDRYDSSESSDR